MARFLDKISTRMWLLAGLMTVITLIVGLTAYYVATYFQLYDLANQMPPKARAELEYLVRTDQKGTDRFYELYDRYGGDTIQTGDLGFVAVIAALSTAIGGLVVLVFAKHVTGPITAVASAAAQVSAGDLTVRVPRGRSSGETGELVDSFNRMASELQAYERERTVLTAGIAHELRTPLTILKGRLHGLIDGVIDPRTGEADRLLRHVEQLSRVVEDLRTLAHADAGELELDLRLIDPADVFMSAVADLKPAAATKGVTFHESYVPSRVRVDPVRLTQIFTNLLTNAIKHAPNGSRITTSTSVDGEWVVATVLDEGAGFAREDVQRLFIPFWRAGPNKAEGRPGSGLGLALAATLAEALNGRIVADNREDTSGASFSVWLPLVGRGSPQERTDTRRRPPWTRRSPTDRA